MPGVTVFGDTIAQGIHFVFVIPKPLLISNHARTYGNIKANTLVYVLNVLGGISVLGGHNTAHLFSPLSAENE